MTAPLYPAQYTEYEADEAFMLRDGTWEKLPCARILLANPRTVKDMNRAENGVWTTKTAMSDDDVRRTFGPIADVLRGNAP
tara:strand:- start:3098 stop:3340 length:243 start_codon:yes stop_codon:yes gene_type:complete